MHESCMGLLERCCDRNVKKKKGFYQPFIDFENMAKKKNIRYYSKYKKILKVI